MGRRTLLLIASILVAAVGTGVVALYANSAQDRALQDAAPVDVYYVVKPIAPGASLATALNSAERRQVSANAAPPPNQRITATLTLPEDRVTTRAINPGELLSLGMFPAAGQQDAGNPLGLGDGRLAVSITVTDVARVAGFAGPGSWVALYVTREDKDKEGQQRTNLLFTDPVKVIKVATAGAPAATPGQTLVTFDLSQSQAARLILANQTESNIYMALVKDGKARLDQDNPITQEQLQTAGTR